MPSAEPSSVPASRLSVVIPFKSSSPAAFAALCARWSRLESGFELIVCDGSPDLVFEANARTSPEWLTHTRVDRERFHHLNDKVNGMCTGVSAASANRILICDDDCLISGEGLTILAYGAASAPVVRLRVDPERLTLGEAVNLARSWISEALKPDGDTSPVFFGRRDVLLSALAVIDGDCLFDDRMLEMRLQWQNSSVPYHRSVGVERVPSRPTKWCEQQIRYAYEDLHALGKTAFFVAWPACLEASIRLGSAVVQLAAAFMLTVAPISLALLGRSRMRRRHPLSVVLLAPVWLAVRTAATFVAITLAATGGYSYGGRRIMRPATFRLWAW